MFAADLIDTKKKNLLSGFLERVPICDGRWDAVAVGNRAIDGDAPPPARAASMSRLGGTFRCSSRRRKAPTTRTSSATQGGDTHEEGRHHHHHHHHHQRALASVSDSTGRRKQKQPPQKFRVERDSRRRERHEKRERFETEFTRTEQTHGEHGGPTLPADITTRRRKQERRAVLEHFIEKVDEKATVEDDIKDKLSSSSHSAHQIIYQGVDGGFGVGSEKSRKHTRACACPNCNFLRKRILEDRDREEVKIRVLEDDRVLEMVGDDPEAVLRPETTMANELKRRERISKRLIKAMCLGIKDGGIRRKRSRRFDERLWRG